MKVYHTYITTASCSNIKQLSLITKGKLCNIILVTADTSIVLLNDFNDHLSIPPMANARQKQFMVPTNNPK
jgi:hypothetical protein